MKKSLLAVALLGASSAAMADSWIYDGSTVGRSDYKGETDTTYSGRVGTGNLPIIGIVAGGTQHGEFTVNGQDTRLTSYYAELKPSIDFGQLHVYAKGGIDQRGKKAKGGKDDDHFDLMYGVGAEDFIFGPMSVGA
ncbi:outer membrane beta-barrel protein, partial [Vibrio parahaemolyticus]|uniref:outer membrane beta-barrel protein n=1 Tax=Vibrio parahaemolyticus TaxID=670 RepID=UPI00062B1897